MSNTQEKSIFRRLITPALIISWLTSCVLIAAFCYSLKVAVGCIAVYHLFLAWSFFVVFSLRRKQWGMAFFLLVGVPMTVAMWPVIPSHRESPFFVCQTRMLLLCKNPENHDGEFLCPLNGRWSLDGAKTFHVGVTLPRWNKSYSVVSHIRVKELPEDFSVMMPYERWKTLADTSIYRSLLGLPTGGWDGTVYIITPLSLYSSDHIRISAAGFISCVENSDTSADFLKNLRERQRTEEHFNINCIFYTLLAAAVSILITEILMVVFLWTRLKKQQPGT